MAVISFAKISCALFEENVTVFDIMWLLNPLRPDAETNGRSGWYPTQFVIVVCQSLIVEPRAIMLNGRSVNVEFTTDKFAMRRFMSTGLDNVLFHWILLKSTSHLIISVDNVTCTFSLVLFLWEK